MPWEKKKSTYTKKEGGNIKNPRQYEELRDQGMSKEKAARITNSDNPTPTKTARSLKGGSKKKRGR